MSDYDSLYVIHSTYNSARQAYEVSIGYQTKDEEVKGRITSVTIVVNVPNHKDNEGTVREAALTKARRILEIASKAPVEES
ncbi:MAG TPA: hypothetical protein VLB01_08355 [Thermodesulfobacteriota bacterium]|nr:hypothetical protein [Thermodesulfobacteriota bacterium]